MTGAQRGTAYQKSVVLSKRLQDRWGCGRFPQPAYERLTAASLALAALIGCLLALLLTAHLIILIAVLLAFVVFVFLIRIRLFRLSDFFSTPSV